MSRDEAQRRLKSVHRAEAVWAYSTIGGMSLAIGAVALIVGRGNFGLGSTAVLAVVIPAIAAVGWIRLRRVTRTNAILCSKCGRDYALRSLRHRDACNTWITGLCASCHTPVLEPRPEPESVTVAHRITLPDFNARFRKQQIASLCVAVPFVISMFLLAFPGTAWMKSRGLIPIQSWQVGALCMAGFIASIIVLAYAFEWIAQCYGVKCPHCGKIVQHAKPIRATGRCLSCGARIIHPDPASSNIMSAP